jgi:hypothetical protein
MTSAQAALTERFAAIRTAITENGFAASEGANAT